MLRQTNSTGAVTLTWAYDAFGNAPASNPGGFGYTGRELDLETGWLQYRARYYDPVMGRFVSEDPIGFTTGPNLYSYVRNNPTNRNDPSGLLSIDDIQDSLFGPSRPTMRCIRAQGTAAGLGVLVMTGQMGRNGDKAGHCLAMCYLRSGCGPVWGNMFALTLGFGKEGFDQGVGSLSRAICVGPAMVRHLKWDPRDVQANLHGMRCGTCPESCESRCANAAKIF